MNVFDLVPGLGAPSDFTVYHQIAQRIVSGKSPFAGLGFNYPPLTAFLLAPLGLVGYLPARWIWVLFSHACLLLSAWLIWRAFGRDRLAALCVAFVWAFGGAAAENLALGQLGPVLVLLLTVAYTRSARTGAVAIGVGIALKFIPGVLTVGLMLRREWRAAGTLLLTAFVLVALPLVALHWMSGPTLPDRADYWMGTPALLNWSVPAVVLRALDPPQRGGSLPYNWEYGNYLPNLHLSRERSLISVGTAVFVFAAGVSALIAVTRGRVTSKQWPLVAAALVALALAASPVCWTHYQILEYPSIAFLLAGAVRARRWLLAVLVLGCGALLYPIPVAMLRAYYQHHGWTAASPATLYAWTSAAPVACLGLFGLCLNLAAGNSPRPSSPPPPGSHSIT